MDEERIREAISRLESDSAEVMAAEARRALADLGPVRRRIFLRLLIRYARKAGFRENVIADVMRLLKEHPGDPHDPPR